MKICLVDIETTGLNPNSKEIVEIGAVIFDSETLKVFEELEMKVMPVWYSLADPEAIALNGFNKDEWKKSGALSQAQAIAVFADHAKDCVLMGQNVAFDWSFLDHAFHKENVVHKINYHKLDLASIAFAMIPEVRSGEISMSLNSLCLRKGVPVESTVHRAINGARTAFEVYKKLKTWNNGEK